MKTKSCKFGPLIFNHFRDMKFWILGKKKFSAFLLICMS